MLALVRGIVVSVIPVVLRTQEPKSTSLSHVRNGFSNVECWPKSDDGGEIEWNPRDMSQCQARYLGKADCEPVYHEVESLALFPFLTNAIASVTRSENGL